MPITPFIEERFPEDISYGSSGGPGFSTEIFEAASGHEQRNMEWSVARARYDVSHGIRDKEDMDDIVDFFYNVRGRAIGFRYKDHADYTIRDQVIGEGTGSVTSFQLIKTYSVNPSLVYTREIRKPVAGTIEGVTVGVTPMVLDTDYTLNTQTGVLTFDTPPPAGQAVTVGYVEFDVPVRFDIDQMDIVQDAFRLESWESIPLVELRV